MGSRSLLCAVIGLLAAAIGAPAALARTGYYQFPDLHEHSIVFAAEGDLWTVADSGGTARRLTTHVGAEYFPRYSPDGKQIAFTGEYGGNRDVYVIPAEGGEPRRLTWHPALDEVVGWTPDGKRIIFRSQAANDTTSGFEWHLFTVPATGGDPEQVPVGWAGRLAIDPATRRWAFNRGNVEFRTWKRYRGGTAPSIWVGDPDKRDFKEVTKTPAAAAFPMWAGGRIFYLSDQGGTGNLWSMKPDGGDVKRETRFTDWDVRWPAVAADGRIVFSLGGDLHIFQPGKEGSPGKAEKIAIDVPSERQLARVRYPSAEKNATSFELSPTGDRVAIVTRGEILSVAVKDGVTLPITRGSAARERGASFSSDGNQLVYITDAPGEEELRIIDAWGRGQPRVVKPAGKTGWHFPPQLSPDGKWLAYGDQTQALYVMPAAGGAPRQVDHSEQSEINEYAWSPDGRYLAYTVNLVTDYSVIRLFDTRTGKVASITGASTNDYMPAWDPEGRYLYFLSDRIANPVMDRRDEENIEIRATKPFLVLLQKDGKNPFLNTAGMPPRPGEPAAKPDDKKPDDGKPAPKPARPIRIDLDGLADRHVAFPVPPGNYAALAATARTVFYTEQPVTGIAEVEGDGPPEVQLIGFDLEKRKPRPFTDAVIQYRLAGDKLAIKKKADLFVVDAAKPPSAEELAEHKVPMSGMVVELAPEDEWRQMFDESWRLMRDFYWDANMGGVDWRAQRDKYRALLPRLGSRLELTDLIGELIGELSTSHTYIRGGDPGTELVHAPTGVVGADVVRRGAAYEITRIYHGDPADVVRSPLAEPGVDVRTGSFVLAVNHRPFAPGQPFLAAFENLADKDIVLTVNTRPDATGARDVVVHPLASEQRLRYVDWVRRNREYVAQKTGGKVGYLHLPDMGRNGLVAFDTWFYPQIDKQAMIVDVRWNGGGFVSQRILERMRRKVLAVSRSRGGSTTTYPVRSVDGPLVVLTNEYAGSDGDIFPTVMQLDKLAPVIGMRSWGGVIGIRGDKLLVDGGLPTQPESAFWDPTHRWGVENRGVVPDIEVQNLPQDVVRAIDAQLDRGLTEIQRLLTQHPPQKRDFGGIQDRSRKAYEKREP
ncbi:MAG TPA: S41 family peptidase [Kofleriaceae bacterium]|nr:S41 family peptidase [Kofleriaceae bacterium]